MSASPSATAIPCSRARKRPRSGRGRRGCPGEPTLNWHSADSVRCCRVSRMPSCKGLEGVGMFNRHGVPRTRIEFLENVPFFEGLPKKTLARIDSHLDEVGIPAGDKLTEQGKAAYETFIIADGVAEVTVGNETVRETTVGELIGELGVLQHTSRTATVTAKTPMRLLVLNPRDLDWLFSDPKLA